MVAFYPSEAAGARRSKTCSASGLVAAALEYLDEGTFARTASAFPARCPDRGAFMVIAEAEALAPRRSDVRRVDVEVLADGALGIHSPIEPRAIAALWRWREAHPLRSPLNGAARSARTSPCPSSGSQEAIEQTLEIGRRHELEACSWGHAGDGNLHSTFLIDPQTEDEVARAEQAAADLFALAGRLGGTVSGEHGVGWVKRGALAEQWAPPRWRSTRPSSGRSIRRA